MKNKIAVQSIAKFFAALVCLAPLLAFAQEPSTLLDSSFALPEKITLSFPDGNEEIDASQMSDWLMQDPQMKQSGQLAEIENTSFCPENALLFCELSRTHKDSLKIKIFPAQKLNTAAIEKKINALADKHSHEAIDAKFSIGENGKVEAFAESTNGIIIKKSESVEKFVSVLLSNKNTSSFSIELPYEKTTPSVTESEASKLGITELIGEGKSNFRGSTKSRIHNINTAVKRFDGAMIAPGEEFSFVKLLGDVDAEHGYLPELVIKKDKTEPEFGGGICQVSTTMFRAAIYSGLEITARKNHAYPVSYYNPQGMDSTIYIPKPDLRFVNNTPGHILIQVKIVGTELTFAFYGTNDGRKIEIDGPRIVESFPDKSMKTTFTQKVLDANGNIVINDTFNSSYDSPYKYPHPGDPMLAAKPENWSQAEWDAYKQAYKEANPPVKKKK